MLLTKSLFVLTFFMGLYGMQVTVWTMPHFAVCRQQQPVSGVRDKVRECHVEIRGEVGLLAPVHIIQVHKGHSVAGNDPVLIGRWEDFPSEEH